MLFHLLINISLTYTYSASLELINELLPASDEGKGLFDGWAEPRDRMALLAPGALRTRTGAKSPLLSPPGFRLWTKSEIEAEKNHFPNSTYQGVYLIHSNVILWVTKTLNQYYFQTCAEGIGICFEISLIISSWPYHHDLLSTNVKKIKEKLITVAWINISQ